VLFYKGEPESRKHLAELLEVSLEELNTAADVLKSSLATHGIRLLTARDELELVTAPDTSNLVTKARKEELVRDLGKAGADTLAIVLYRGEVSRADVEYIRGVNSSFILRNLLIRGLVERIPNPKNARSVLYRPTAALLKHLGVTDVKELPEFDAVQQELDVFEERKHEEDQDEQHKAQHKEHTPPIESV